MIGQIRSGESGSVVILMAISILPDIRMNDPIRAGITDRAELHGVSAVISGLYALYQYRIEIA